MRRLIALLLGVLAISAGVSSYLDRSQAQQTAWLQGANTHGTAFAIPSNPTLADPTVTAPLLATAARDAKVNVFRTAIEYGADDHSQIVLYALLAAPTHVDSAFALASGRWLTPDDSHHPERFLSTLDAGDPDQVGRLADFGGGDDVTVRHLDQAFDSLPVAGAYVVEAADRASTDDFFRLFSNAASSAAGGSQAFQPKDFRAETPRFFGVESEAAPILIVVQLMIVLATTLLIAFRVLHRAKAVGVMQLQGLGRAAIWYHLTGRLIIAVGLGSAVVVCAGTLLVRDSSAAFATEVALSIARAFAVMLVGSGVASAAILVSRPSDSIKNRKPTRALFALSALVKAAFTLALIAAVAGFWLQFRSAADERARLAGWDLARGYGIFYPVSNGNDQVDMTAGQEGYTPAVVEGLYPVLDADGALYIDATAYEPTSVAAELEPGAFRAVTVNVNYLKRFPVRDPEGNPVDVDNAAVDWIVLVPERLRDREADLEAWFSQVQHSRRAAEAAFGGTVPDAIANQGLRIVWLADGQDVFSFDPLVQPEAGNMIEDPIIEVMTAANSIGMDRANAITGDAAAALKVPLGGSAATAVLADLEPVLRSLTLDDNLRHLVTIDDYAALEVARIESTMGTIAVSCGVLLVGLIYLGATSIAVLFERYARRVVVRRLHGIGFVRRYREAVLVFGVIWTGQLLGALALNRLGTNAFAAGGAHRVADDAVVAAVAVAVAVIEGAMSAVVITSIERRGIARLLKEEF